MRNVFFNFLMSLVILESCDSHNKKIEFQNGDYSALIRQLDSINFEDQATRTEAQAIESKYGHESVEVNNFWKLIKKKDSSNTLQIQLILERYGWLGKDKIGDRGSQTLFLVIQHSDPKTQQRYLPLLKEAVKNGKADAGNLALLEDRVAMGKGEKQIYGSQVFLDTTSKRYCIWPLFDPDNADKRRREVGLDSLGRYLRQWNILWDCEEYKRDSRVIEEKAKAIRF